MQTRLRLTFHSNYKVAHLVRLQSPAIEQNRWHWLVICLLSPAGGALLRKILPGQPTYAEVAAVLPILLAALLLSRQGRILPKWVALPLLYWAVFQTAFTVPAIIEDWRLGIAVLFTRVAPMLMALIAYNTIKSWSDFQKASYWVGGLAVLLFPVGLIVVFWGNSVLPVLLQPIEKVLVAERDLRSGFPTAATIFTTQWILSWSMLASLFVVLASLLSPKLFPHTNRQTIFLYVAALASVALIYSSLRRGVLVAACIGVVTYFVMSRRVRSSLAVVLVAALAVGISQIIDAYGYGVGMSSRSEQSFILNELDPVKRVTDVFLPFFLFWLKTTPLGNYTGYAGPEVKSLGIVGFEQYSQVVEVGGAQLIAEMGVIGALVLPLVLLIVATTALYKSRRLQSRNTIQMLILFQLLVFSTYYFKELLALVNPSMGVFFFWAIPGLCAALIELDTSNGSQVETL